MDSFVPREGGGGSSALPAVTLATGHDFIRVGCDDYIGHNGHARDRRVHASTSGWPAMSQHFLQTGRGEACRDDGYSFIEC